MPSHKTRVAQRAPFNLTQRTAGRAQNVQPPTGQGTDADSEKRLVAPMVDEAGIRRKHKILAAERHDLCLPKTPHAPKSRVLRVTPVVSLAY